MCNFFKLETLNKDCYQNISKDFQNLQNLTSNDTYDIKNEYISDSITYCNVHYQTKNDALREQIIST